MNLEKINFDQMFHVKNVHRPVRDVCKHANIVFENKPLMVHHYIGSWEHYNAREDARRTRAKFNKKGLLDYGKPIYHMQGWLNEFVDRIGLSQSQDLLRDVGVIKVGKLKIRESPYYPRISDFEKLDENIPVEKRYFGVNGEILPTNA